MFKFALFVGLVCSLSAMLLQAADYVPRGTADIEVSTQFETTGVDAEYVHGRHCVDGRAF
jgi:hypothetical protein